MNKYESLLATHQKFLKIGLCILPMDDLEEIASSDYMGFGTTADERMFSLTDLRNLILRQKEQSAGMDIRYDIQSIHCRLSPHGLSAFLADDINIFIKMGDEEIQIPLRFSSMYEYLDSKWIVVHSHGSKPENVATEEDTWGIEDWKQRNLELETQVKERTAELEKSLDNLRATQAQLIQSEKMASLGELTAGIAHEIQNPLNFVNNFSELSVELASELIVEVDKLEIPEKNKEYFVEIIGDLSKNQEKIALHGNRASNIVKGMLEHSRKNTGERVLTDLNALADEYLRLSYHGLRAKNRDFNAELVTAFDPSLTKIEVVSQDIGRVVLNLINNAFHAVEVKSKKGIKDYQPTVSISTSQLCLDNQNFAVISIKDNGDGIPKEIIDKIFQPFFTTKPSGQGTGLGLSLSYDILKAHRGEIKVLSVEGEHTEFTILIPL